MVRIFNTYGPRMALDDGRVVSNFVAQALTDQDLTVYGDGQQTRSFQYVSDLIKGQLPVHRGWQLQQANVAGLAQVVRQRPSGAVHLCCLIGKGISNQKCLL